MTTTSHEMFIALFNKIEVVVEPKDEYNNGTGYFDHICRAKLGLEVGTRFKMQTPEGNNRKLIGVVTPIGNVVFFERYTAGDRGLIAQNFPRGMAGLYPVSQPTSAETLEQAFGGVEGWGLNIGQVLNSVLAAARRLETEVESEAE